MKTLKNRILFYPSFHDFQLYWENNEIDYIISDFQLDPLRK